MSTVTQKAQDARTAGASLAGLPDEQRSALLNRIADKLLDAKAQAALFEANRQDVEQAQKACAAGELDQALVDRLRLSPDKLASLADGLQQLARMPAVIGKRDLYRELDDGLVLERRSCPLGLVAVVFESRPDAVVQISGLTIKSGNAVLLKGGREAARSNAALAELLREALAAHDVEPGAVTLLQDRSEVADMLALDTLVDMVVARGSSAFVRYIQANTKIPVMGHAEGLCHVYLHDGADAQMAARIVADAKLSYPAACNTMETLLWSPAAANAADAAIAALLGRGVELLGCAQTVARHPKLSTATDEDYATEWGTAKASVRCVASLEEAVAHIMRFGSGHTEAIVTEDEAAAEIFLQRVDAASVFWNASTRFADGYRYGLGAEVGISTGKLHARGPVGVEGLTTTRYVLRGSGQVSTDYGPGKRTFRHHDREL